MRAQIAVAAATLALLVIGISAAGAAPIAAAQTRVPVLSAAVPATFALAAQPKDVNVDINVNKGGGDWYKNPYIVGIAVLLVVVIVVLASRGGGTTIIEKKE